jgi:glycerol-3-phosphate cytidylyltransferase-like family protein
MLKKIKTIYPQSSLFVGIETSEHDIFTLEERKEYLRMCKYVDEICEEENVKPTCSFLSYYNIDMIVILNDDEDMYEGPTLKVRFESMKTELVGRVKKA